VRKLPGASRAGDITLVRGLTDGQALDELWEWHQEIRAGTVERRNGSIIIYDQTGSEVSRWHFTNGWPSKWVGPTLGGEFNEVATESITLAIEAIERG
jgi:phage tail-like protein